MQKKTIRQKFDNLSRWNTQQTTNNTLYQHQHNKCHYEKRTTMGKERKLFLWGQEEGKDAHSALQFNKALKPLEQLDEKKKSKVSNWKRSKFIFFPTWQSFIGKSHKDYKRNMLYQKRFFNNHTKDRSTN